MKLGLGSTLSLLLLALGCGREESFPQSKAPLIKPPLSGPVVAPDPPPPEPASIKGGPITDSHIHLWKLPRNQPPMDDEGAFPRSSPAWLARDAMIPDYDATLGGPLVDRIVVIESSAGVPASKVIAANQWMLNQVKEEPKLMSVVGSLDVNQEPKGFEEQLNQLTGDQNFVGLRIGGDVLGNDGQVKENASQNLGELSRRGLMVDTLDTAADQVAKIAVAFPDLVIVINHMAQKSFDFEAPEGWLARLEKAAAQPNIYLKVSDTGRFSQGDRSDGWNTPYPSEDDPSKYTTVFQAVWDMFGEDRLIFGSNWPVSNVAGDFVTQIAVLESFLKAKGQAARDKVMHGNAQKVYGPRPLRVPGSGSRVPGRTN